MEKKHNIKLYNKLGEFKNDINNNIIKNNIQFTNIINVGQSDMELVISLKIDSNIFNNQDIIEIYEFFENEADYNLIYKGQIKNIRFDYRDGAEEIVLTIIGLGNIFNNGHNSNSTITLTEPADFIRDYINNINLKYNLFTYGDIQDYGTDISIELKGKNYLESVKLIAKTIGYYFYINPNGSVDFRPFNSIDKYFTKGLDIQNMSIDKTAIGVYNTLILEWNNGVSQDLYENITSVNELGVLEDYIKQKEITDQATANIFGDNFLSTNKDEKWKMELLINNKNKVNINELIGKKAKILGLKEDIPSQIIEKVSYTSTGIKVSGNEQNNFVNEIQKTKTD